MTALYRQAPEAIFPPEGHRQLPSRALRHNGLAVVPHLENCIISAALAEPASTWNGPDAVLRTEAVDRRDEMLYRTRYGDRAKLKVPEEHHGS